MQPLPGIQVFLIQQLKIKRMQQSTTNSPPQEELSMPTKITDCIFMSDDVIAHDIEWLTLNQITHIINCAGRHSTNSPVIKGMCFLTFDWTENNVQNIIDQNVINAVVGFIEEVRQEHGTVLLHGWRSDSRPFCLIAIYFMIKYQWSIYKTLEYLNARKEGTEVDEVFIHQLNTLHNKLSERGLIKSKQWVVTAQTSEQQILLTNTFLNSRRRQIEQQRQAQKKKKALKSISWKETISEEHVYCQSATISQINQAQARPSILQTKPRSDSAKSRKQSQPKSALPKSITGKILVAKQELRADKTSSILTEMNVTKKWTELRQSWMKEKENINSNTNLTCIANSETPLYLKKEQRINDRLQDKISILKSQIQGSDSNKLIGQGQPKIAKENSVNSMLKKMKEQGGKPKQGKKDGLIGLLTSEEGKDSRILHNNWIINNQVLKQTTNLKNQKQSSSKSVIVVKPNHALQPSEQLPSRTSLRKAGSEKKPQKQEINKKFFGEDKAAGDKMRSNSVKQQRGLGNSMIMKTGSLIGKGKWKM